MLAAGGEMKKQVEKDHYEFSRYVSKRRMMSIWYQLDEVLGLQPKSVLEIGPGPGVFKAFARLFDVPVETLDLDPDLNPDHVASAEAMPFLDSAFDVVCAFQMLEHVPYEVTLRVFTEMARVAANYVVISLPDARPLWSYSFHVPKKGEKRFLLPRPWIGPKKHDFDGQHYWEISKRGYNFKRVAGDLIKAGNMQMVRNFRVSENPYHRFMVFRHRRAYQNK